MLNQAQIQAARSQLGITPVAGTSNPAPQDRAAVLQKAWGTSGQGTTDDVPKADPLASVHIGGSDTSNPIEDIENQAKGGVGQIKQGLNSGSSDSLLKEGEAGLDVASGAASVITSPLAPIFKPVGDAVQGIADKISDVPAVQKFAMSDAGKDVARGAQDVSNAANVAGTVAGVGEGIDATPETLAKAKGALNDAVGTSPGPDGTGGGGIKGAMASVKNLFASQDIPGATSDVIEKSPGGIMDTIRGKLAEPDPRLAISASRLDEPATEYEKMAQEATDHVSDAKADAPTQRIGSEIGDQYDNVASMRRSVGQQMGIELDKVKDTPIDISDAYKTFSTEAKKGAGKMTSFDQGIIQKYSLELKSLGDNPTTKDIDDFLGRVPEELNVAKSASNITKVTNAERIIKGSLAKIRSSLISAPGMEDYAVARQSYADLSGFLDEGSKYLGAKTQSGDYARDASVAKGAVESLVGGGKKDWLLKLQALTGYPAIDKIVLGIQAMKDAGDPSGLSLFKAMSQGEIPTSPTGLAGKLMSWGLEKGKKVVGGSPAQRTAAFLRTLKK